MTNEKKCELCGAEGLEMSGAVCADPKACLGRVTAALFKTAESICDECSGTKLVSEDGRGALGYVVSRPCPKCCTVDKSKSFSPFGRDASVGALTPEDVTKLQAAEIQGTDESIGCPLCGVPCRNPTHRAAEMPSPARPSRIDAALQAIKDAPFDVAWWVESGPECTRCCTGLLWEGDPPETADDAICHTCAWKELKELRAKLQVALDDTFKLRIEKAAPSSSDATSVEPGAVEEEVVEAARDFLKQIQRSVATFSWRRLENALFAYDLLCKGVLDTSAPGSGTDGGGA